MDNLHRSIQNLGFQLARSQEPFAHAGIGLSDIRHNPLRPFADAHGGAKHDCRIVSFAHVLKDDMLKKLFENCTLSIKSLEKPRECVNSGAYFQKPDLAAEFLLRSAVHRFVSKAFCDPTFAFEGGFKDPVLHRRAAHSIRHLLTVLETHDCAGAQGLKRRLLHLLDPEHYRPDQARKQSTEIAKTSQAVATRKGVNTFVDSVASG